MKLVIRTLDLPVIQFPAPIGRLAQNLLQLDTGNHVERPRLQLPENVCHRSVQRHDVRTAFESLSIRRIADETAILVTCRKLVERLLLKVNIVSDARQFRMMAGKADRFRFDIGSDDLQGQSGLYQVAPGEFTVDCFVVWGGL